MPVTDASLYIDLGGPDGNAFFIMAKAKAEMQRAGANKEVIDEYLSLATSGDYEHLLKVTADYLHFDFSVPSEDWDDYCDSCGNDIYECEC